MPVAPAPLRLDSSQAEAWRRWGYIAVERGAAELAKLAGPSDSLVFVSDHGMAPITKAVAIGKALHDAGLSIARSSLSSSSCSRPTCCR